MPETRFLDPPRATRQFRGYHAKYTKPTWSSFNWQGSDWESPTALTFQTETLDAQKLGMRVAIDAETPIHPAHLTDILATLWEDFRRGVVQAQHVVDADERLGVLFDTSHRHSHLVVLDVSAKCWPATPGITSPVPDVTW